MGSLDITNYDVLVEPPEHGRWGDYQLAKHKNHVGNNRLQVFLNLYQEGYNDARMRGDNYACNNIVEKIVGTVCHQCVPRGRFLVSADGVMGNVTWSALDEETIKSLLHSVLQPSNPGLDMKPAPQRPGFDDGQKRRRRSSLLRRSASESMVGMMHDSKKKLSRNDMARAAEEPNWRSDRAGNDGMLTLGRLDVVLTPARNALDPNSQSLGNNRLHILVAMQSTKYQQASYDGKEAVLDEVMKTVNVFWRGRFMVEGLMGYEELSKEDARDALRSIFEQRAGSAITKRHSVASHPTHRSSSFVRPAPLAFSKQASMTLIPTAQDINMPDVNDLRSAAVKSLQKQKARQNIANRLEQLQNNSSPSNPNKSTPTYTPFPFGGRHPTKRESTVLGKLDASVMAQLVADVDDEDNDDQPLPPTNSNIFGSQFIDKNNYMDL